MTEEGMTIPDLKAARDVSEAHVSVVRTRLRELEIEIDQAAAAVKAGSVPGSTRLNELAVEKSDMDRESAPKHSFNNIDCSRWHFSTMFAM